MFLLYALTSASGAKVLDFLFKLMSDFALKNQWDEKGVILHNIYLVFTHRCILKNNVAPLQQSNVTIDPDVLSVL